MVFRATLVALLGSSLLALSPVSSWSRPSQDGYDCVKVGKKGYQCVKGPLTGQFGLMLVPSIDELPARPRFGCAEDALAPELD